MATAASATNQAAILKQIYPGKMQDFQLYKNRPFFAKVAKFEGAGSGAYVEPIHYEDMIGGVGTFTRAQTDGKPSLRDAISITCKDTYAVGVVNNKLLAGTKNDKQAFLQIMRGEFASAFNRMGHGMAKMLWGDGIGSIGQITRAAKTKTTVTSKGKTLTLKNGDDIVNYAKGMKLDLARYNKASNDSRGVFPVIASVNRSGGKIVLSTSLTFQKSSKTSSGTTSSSSTATKVFSRQDYIYQYGNRDACISGVAAWILTTPATTTAFNGLNRSVDSKLCGLYVDGSGGSVEEALLEAMNELYMNGEEADMAFLPPKYWKKLELELGSKRIYDKSDVQMGEVGFKALEIVGPAGFVKVLPDRYVTADTGYMLSTDTWKMISIGKAPQILAEGGGKFLRMYNADAHEFRLGSYWNLVCNKPWANCRIKLA